MTTINVPPRAASLDDWRRLNDEDPGHRYEVDKGNIIIMVPATPNHQTASSRLFAWLLGTGVPPDLILMETGLALAPTTGRIPDLIVLRERPAPGTLYVDPRAVRLAVEVVSDSSMTADHVDKPAEYAAAGIPNFWRVDDASYDVDNATVTCFALGSAGAYTARITKEPLTEFVRRSQAML
jgi:Uma2 family endonuclease